MNSIASEAQYRQRVVKYSYKHGVNKAGNRFRRSRQAIYEWRAKYDGNWKSLLDRSHRPKSHPKQHTKPYQRAEYPGKKVQIDVKFVPSWCVSNGQKYYQYTAIDECTRIVFRQMYNEHSTFSSKDFLIKLIQTFSFPIREIQTDNGTEWTTQLLVKNPKNKTLFERALANMDILHHRIRVATPQHNGKTERQHRTDEKRFHKKKSQKQIKGDILM